MWRLIIEKGSEKGRIIKIKGDGSISIGGAQKNGITLDDELISDVHCLLTTKGEKLFIEDCQSEIGTQVNYEDTKKGELKEGDLIQVGASEIWVLSGKVNPLLGNTLGGYLFHIIVGRGGQGIVYLAEQVNLHRIVAVKVLDPTLASIEEKRKCFLDEARIAATLNHTHLVGIYDIVEEGEYVFFSTEYMSEGSLEDLLSIHKKLPIEDVLNYLIQASEGLSYLHNKGLVHKDIKPANFMLDEEGTLKIGDFGIASAGNTSTKGGKVLGSPYYISPEQILKKELDSRCDLYSLGCTAFKLMTGRPLFTGKTIKEILTAHLKSRPTRFRDAVPEIKNKVAKILDTLLSKNPDNRYNDASEFKEELENAMKSSSVIKTKRAKNFKRRI